MQNYELFLRFHHKLAVFLFYFTNFDFIESTSIRKISNIFGFSLTYSYLCTPNDENNIQ
jgi:hypothetical protein